jgi:hypothetical protein
MEAFMTFRISGLDPTPFRPLYGLGEAALAERGVERHVATHAPGFPDRVELRDAAPGESLLLLNFTHQPAATPYRAAHAIFVREGADQAALFENSVPAVMQVRPISLRAFDAAGHMRDADLAPGTELEPLIARLFTDPAVAYLHAHYARQGCYAARIDRS